MSATPSSDQQGLIGYSLQDCVPDMVKYGISIDAIAKIIGTSKCKNLNDWERAIDKYALVWKAKLNPEQIEKAKQIAWELVKAEKIDQPKLRGESVITIPGYHWQHKNASLSPDSVASILYITEQKRILKERIQTGFKPITQPDKQNAIQ